MDPKTDPKTERTTNASPETVLLLACSDVLRTLHPHLNELHEAVAGKFAKPVDKVNPAEKPNPQQL